MKVQIKKWALRFSVTILFIITFLLIIILNPILSYANKTRYNNYTIYHNKTLDPRISNTLGKATEILKKSKSFNSKLQFDICLNDGSKYPNLIQKLLGRAFAWGFYNKVVLKGNADFTNNYVELNGYKWNLIQLLVHEMTHCLQYDKLGFWKSKPVANIENWKWEGYAEYVSRQEPTQKNLKININRLEQSNKELWCITFDDNTISPKEYYNYWIMVQYCLDIKKQTYQELLKDHTSEMIIKNEMMHWYNH